MSSKYVEDKRIVMEFNNKVYEATADNMGDILKEYYHEDVSWNGPQPFNHINGVDSLSETFWKPLLEAMPDLQKDAYIHITSKNKLPEQKDDDWVVTSGNFVGTFKNDWLGITASKGAVWIRYVEYNRLEDGKIKEVYTLIDILDLIRQAGFVFIPPLAQEIVVPGPATNDGVIMGEVDEEESQKTFQLVYNMIYEGLFSFEENGMGKMGVERYFDKDFMWYGPCGIGSTRGIKGFEDYHQKPFLDAVPDRRSLDDVEDRIYMSEGKFASLLEWTGFVATHTGPDWMGMPPTNKHIVMRCIDLYRREGDTLVENWVFLDMIDILLQIGVDVFERLKTGRYFRR